MQNKNIYFVSLPPSLPLSLPPSFLPTLLLSLPPSLALSLPPSLQTDRVSKGSHPLRGCGGCTRVSGEGKQFVIFVTLNNTQPLLLATANEEELTHWMQALCEGVVQVWSLLFLTKFIFYLLLINSATFHTLTLNVKIFILISEVFIPFHMTPPHSV